LIVTTVHINIAHASTWPTALPTWQLFGVQIWVVRPEGNKLVVYDNISGNGFQTVRVHRQCFAAAFGHVIFCVNFL
jgi:hypothetical protein